MIKSIGWMAVLLWVAGPAQAEVLDLRVLNGNSPGQVDAEFYCCTDTEARFELTLEGDTEAYVYRGADRVARLNGVAPGEYRVTAQAFGPDGDLLATSPVEVFHAK